jgi:hypothetical protein
MKIEEGEPRDQVIAACLARSRQMVLRILVASVFVVLVGGLALRNGDRGAPLWAEINASRVTHGLLFTIIFWSYFTRRALASRTALRDPQTRFQRFSRAHILSAAVGALAVPLGLVHGLAIRPKLDAVGPFWVAALALEFLAIPREYELSDFDQPMVLPAEQAETWQ